MNKNFYIKIFKKQIIVYLIKKIFICQFLLPSTSIYISKKLYTFLYITKILNNFGLIEPINKKFGY